MSRFKALPTLFIAFGLVAQDGPKGPVTAPTIQRVSLQDAIQTALKNNLQVGIAEQVRDATKAGVLINEGAFDLSLQSGLSFGHTKGARTGFQFVGAPLSTSESETTTRNLDRKSVV